MSTEEREHALTRWMSGISTHAAKHMTERDKAMWAAGYTAARRTPPPATAEIIAIWRREAKYRKESGGYLPERIGRMLAEWPDAASETPGRDADG